MGIGAALLAFGIQLSIDYDYDGAIYPKAKTTEIREHYISTTPEQFLSVCMIPSLLLINDDAARELFSQYLKER